jgi:DNA-binding NtrC family response regulator
VIFQRFFTGSVPRDPDDVSETLSAVERRHILAVFESSGESVEQTARRLGISETLTRNRLKRYGRHSRFRKSACCRRSKEIAKTLDPNPDMWF